MPTDTRIIIQGCDEATEVTLALTISELSVVRRLAEAVNWAAAGDACHPHIEVV